MKLKLSGIFLARRLAGIAFCGILVWFAFADAVSRITRDSNPRFALRFNSAEPVALAAEADRLLSASDNNNRNSQVTTLARQSISVQALNPRALRILSVVSENGKSAYPERLLDLSARLSKRELGTQLWQIEKSIAQGNITDALRHYDQAMRTHVESRALLFPVLAGALDDAGIRRAFAPYIARSPSWLHDFLVYALGNEENAESVAETILAAKGLPKASEFREVESLILWRLASSGDPLAAKRFYLSLPGASAKQLQSLDFSEASTAPAYAPLTWAAISSGAGSGGFAKHDDSKSSVFRAEVAAGEHVTVARKMLFLAPGSYTLSTQVDSSGMLPGAAGEFVISCASNGKAVTLWSGNIRSSATGNAIRVEPSCVAQYADIRLYGGDNQSGSEFVVKRLSLVPGKPASVAH